MTAYLGVDGGGTKTAFRLIDADGNTLATSQQSTSYYFEEGMHVLERVLRAGVADVTTSAGIAPADIAYAFFAVPGYGEASADIPAIDAIVKSVLGHDRFTCGNDMLAGWAGSLAGGDGINVIAGTGSMTYGERLGVGHRVGGWGEIFGDEGSAYWIGIQGLNLFSRMSDGREPKTILHELMRQRVGVESDLDLVGVVLSEWGAKRSAIADLAKVVVQAADAGDPRAMDVLRAGAAELVAIVDATRRAVGYPDGEVALVSYSGGMFSVPTYLELFTELLDADRKGYELITPRHTPDLGSALYAIKCAGAVVPELAPTA